MIRANFEANICEVHGSTYINLATDSGSKEAAAGHHGRGVLGAREPQPFHLAVRQ
jgi:hypothetical protein